MAVNVVIDAGHGGFDNGAVYNGRREKDDNLKIALALGELLQQRGINVDYTRTEDVYDSPTQKARIANETGADYLVSIHRNAAYAPNTYEGVQTLVYENTGVRNRLAEAINNNLEEVGFNNIGVEVRKDLAILRRSNMPAVLVEVGFIDNDTDNALLDANFDRTVQAIADGIIEAVGTQAASSGMQGMPPARAVSGSIQEAKAVSAGAQENGAVPGNIPASASVQAAVSVSEAPKAAQSVHSRVKGIDMIYDRDEDGEYKLQAGLFRVYRYAKDLQRELTAMGYDTALQKEGEYYVVYVEGFKNLDEAAKAEAELKRKGYDNFIV